MTSADFYGSNKHEGLTQAGKNSRGSK